MLDAALRLYILVPLLATDISKQPCTAIHNSQLLLPACARLEDKLRYTFNSDWRSAACLGSQTQLGSLKRTKS